MLEPHPSTIEDGVAGQAQPSEEIAVTVIVPVYNAKKYLTETVESALSQSTPQIPVEVIAVDDGSTDGSDALLDELAAAHSHLSVIHQVNSGGPSAPRNAGLRRARGRYVYFLDSDDVLAEKALEGMVQVADSEGSDVVLGRFGSLNGRHVPQQMFRKTVLDADVIETNAWDSLGPIKLFRRSLVERLGLSFAEDQWIGEDQPFTASMYLNAQKVSVLADRVYTHIRKRDDGQNITMRRQTLEDKAKTAVRLARVVSQFTEPGARRDRLMRRVFTATLPEALGRLLLAAEPQEVDEFTEIGRRDLRPHYSAGVAAYCSPVGQIKNHLFMCGSSQALLDFVRYEQENGGVDIVVADGHANLELPPTLATVVPEELRTDVAAPRPIHRLTELDTGTNAIRMTGTAGLQGVPTPLSDIRAILVERKSGEEVAVPVRMLGQRAANKIAMQDFTIELSGAPATTNQLKTGAWGIFLDLELNGLTQRVRFGKKVPAVEADRVTLTADDDHGRRPIIGYFNRGYNNLTFDVGGHIHPNALLVNDVIGIDAHADPVPHLTIVIRLLATHDKPPMFVSAEGQRLSARRIGADVFSVIYPVLQTPASIALTAILGPDRHTVALPSPDWLDSVDAQAGKSSGELIIHGIASPQATGTIAKSDKGPLNVYWWEGTPNFGDILGPWLVEMMTGRQVTNTKGVFDADGTLVTVGSLLNYLDRAELEIWGSGLIAPLSQADIDRLSKRRPRAIHAVRGKRTRDELVSKLGWSVPEVYGDPALLLPRFFKPEPSSQPGRIAVVPHYAHKKHMPRQLDPACQFIDVGWTPEQVITEINSSSACLSTSLHGIIMAQAYGVPWVWLRIADNPLVGDEFKFEDFFSSIGVVDAPQVSLSAAALAEADYPKIAEQAVLPQSSTSFDELLAAFPERW